MAKERYSLSWKNMNPLDKCSHLSASCPGPLSYPHALGCSLGEGEWQFLSPGVGQTSEFLRLCPTTDWRLPAHAALCSDHAAASPARYRHRGPAAQAGAAQAHGPVSELPMVKPVTPQPCPISSLCPMRMFRAPRAASCLHLSHLFQEGPRQLLNRAAPQSLPLISPGSSSPRAPVCCSPGVQRQS